MPVRPLAHFDVQELESVDDALLMLDANLEDLMTMCVDQPVFGPKEIWTLDKNILFLKNYCDRLEALIREEKKQ
jgi:hypothetical protein